MAKIKLSDVAERAAVSKSTVSQYLNGRFDYMSEKTRERIAQAVKDLNYVPNFAARSLKTDKTKLIGVIVRDIAGQHTGEVLRAIDDFCKANGYNVLIHNTDFDPELESASLKTLHNLNVDGIIMMSSGENEWLISDYISKGLPIVHFQLEHNEPAKNLVVSENKKAAFEATQYLLGLGHNRICFLSQGFASVRSRRERYAGFLEAYSQNNLEPYAEHLQYWNRENGFKTPLQHLLSTSNPPTAFFSQHLAITVDLLKFLKTENISIPDQVSVLGFDDIPMAEFMAVPLTVMKQNASEIGREAADLLLETIQHPATSKRVIIPCELIQRKSCCPPQ